MKPYCKNLKSEPKQGRKIGDDVVNNIRDTLDRFKQGFTDGNPRLVERYLESEIHILLEFSIRGTDEKFVARFRRETFRMGHVERAQGSKRFDAGIPSGSGHDIN